MHPYTTNVDLCEQLIYYCARVYRKHNQDDTNANDAKDAEDQLKSQKKIDEMISKNKMQAFERVNENSMQERQKKGRKRRDGTGVVYEDDNNLSMEFPLIQKFGKVSVSPPVDVDELPKCEKSL